MITIRGKQFSEDTIVEALEKHCNFKKQYIFKAGDVVKYDFCGKTHFRIIAKIVGMNDEVKDELVAVTLQGESHAISSRIRNCDYEKIGTLDDFIKVGK